MHALQQDMDVIKDATAQPAFKVSSGCPAPVPEEVHEQLRQHAGHIHDELDRKDVALQAELKRAQVSSAVIEKLRKELLQNGKANSDTAKCVQRISALEAELHRKNIELQNEVQRADLSCETIKVLREEIQKKGPCPAQLSVVILSSHNSRRVYKYVKYS